jgi:hypothetical protein
VSATPPPARRRRVRFQPARSIPSAQYIKDIFSKLPLSSTNTVAAQSSGFFPVQNIFNSRQEIARVDHTVSDRLSLWGKFENDSIPTVEPGGLFTGAAIPGIAVTDTNAPGRSFVIHAVATLRPNLLNDMAFNYAQSGIHSTPAGLMNKSQNPDINVPEPFVNTQGVVPELTFTNGSSLLDYGPYNEYNAASTATITSPGFTGRTPFASVSAITATTRRKMPPIRKASSPFRTSVIPARVPTASISPLPIFFWVT